MSPFPVRFAALVFSVSEDKYTIIALQDTENKKCPVTNRKDSAIMWLQPGQNCAVSVCPVKQIFVQKGREHGKALDMDKK